MFNEKRGLGLFACQSFSVVKMHRCFVNFYESRGPFLHSKDVKIIVSWLEVLNPLITILG